MQHRQRRSDGGDTHVWGLGFGFAPAVPCNPAWGAATDPRAPPPVTMAMPASLTAGGGAGALREGGPIEPAGPAGPWLSPARKNLTSAELGL